MKNSTLTDRIRNVRIRTRAQQPLKYRVELVRARSKKVDSGSRLRTQEQFERSN